MGRFAGPQDPNQATASSFLLLTRGDDRQGARVSSEDTPTSWVKEVKNP